MKQDVFTEKETEKFYDEHDAIYRSFWDQGGSLHWGLYESNAPFQCTSEEFVHACIRLNRWMGQKSQITGEAMILDAGCGNGNTSIWIAHEYPDSNIIGIDLSATRIANANQLLAKQSDDVQKRVKFVKGSLTTLPFEDNFFTHIISQATLYHVNHRIEALRELYRVLKPGGSFILDDLLKPHSNISADSKKFVYDRLLFDTDFNFLSYQEALNRIGFHVMYAEDISEHLAKSYSYLQEITKTLSQQNTPHSQEYKDLSMAYNHMVEAIRRQDLGWAMITCKKNSP